LKQTRERPSDKRDLLDHQMLDVRTAEAGTMFCYQVKKWTGAFVALEEKRRIES